MSQSADDHCLCTELVSVTERSALALGRSLGRGDAPRALDEGLRGIREGLELVPLSGRIAIGITDHLPVDTVVGAGGRHYDLAIGPLQEAIVARGQVGVISVLAATDPGGMLTVPAMYMRKLAVGHVARGHIDLLAPVGDNIRAIAEAFGRKPMDITAIVLDRDRHDDLVEEIRETGARIKLIQDGDVTAAISSAIRGTNDHVAIGIGGAAEGVISAAALTCSRRRVPGAAVARLALAGAGDGRAGNRGHAARVHGRGARARRCDRRRDRRLERRPAAWRALRRRCGAHALDRHVHPLQPCPLR